MELGPGKGVFHFKVDNYPEDVVVGAHISILIAVPGLNRVVGSWFILHKASNLAWMAGWNVAGVISPVLALTYSM